MNTIITVPSSTTTSMQQQTIEITHHHHHQQQQQQQEHVTNLPQEENDTPSPIHLHVNRSTPRRKMSASARTLLQLPQLTRADSLGIKEENIKVSPRMVLQQHQLNKVQNSLKELQNSTHFGELELKNLFHKYSQMVTEYQGRMNKQLFVDCCQELLKLNRDDPLIEQYYKIFDRDDNGFIDFREFVTGASILLKGTPREKIQFVFSCYDLNGNGTIEKSEMKHWLSSMFNQGVQMLEDVLKTLNVQQQQQPISRSEIMRADMIEKIVDTCFMQANNNNNNNNNQGTDNNNDNTITEEQFIHWVERNEQVMKLLSPGIQM